MHQRLNHRATSSSKSTSGASATHNGSASLSQQTEETKKRRVTESGERLPENERPTITPVGLHWTVTPFKGSRKPATVMGALVREMYPDVVDTENGPRPVLRWEDFKKTRTHGVPNDQRVLAEFWWRFKCDERHRAEADKVLELNFRKRVTQALAEEKKAAFQNLYKDGNVPAEELDEEGNRWPTEAALISANPEHFTNNEGWGLLCAHWSTPAHRRMSILGKRNRLAGGPDAVYHRNGSRSLVATRQYLIHQTGVDPGETGAWLHTHKLEKGIDSDQLCNENATEKWAQYADAMEKKHGPNWRAEHPDFDAAVLYDEVGRTPHGRLAIGDEAISTTEKEHIKTRARRAHTHVSAREMRLQREVDSLRKKNKNLLGLEHVVRVLAAKGGHDFDALLHENAPDLITSESDVGFSSKHERGGLGGIEQTDANGGTYDSDNDDYNDDEVNYDDEGNYHDGSNYYVDHNDEYYAPGDKENLWD